jgi:GNAT superfamily N-acetyltransferase
MPLTLTLTEGVMPIEKVKEAVVQITDSLLKTHGLTGNTVMTPNITANVQIEAVRIRKDHRGTGLGSEMFEWAINRAKKRGAHLLQLTTDKKRPDALRFYENLGFNASHEGMKMHFKAT